MTISRRLAIVAALALLVGVSAREEQRLLRAAEPEAPPTEDEPGVDLPAPTGAASAEPVEYVRDFPHDKTFEDHAERLIPSHEHMMSVAKNVTDVQPVHVMLKQLDVLRNYLTKLSVRHEFLLEKYHAILEGGQDAKLRRMVAEIVGEELKQREAQREALVNDIVGKVVDILKKDLALGDEGQQKSDEELQKEAVAEAVAEATEEREEGGEEPQTDEVGGTDRVLDDFDAEEA